MCLLTISVKTTRPEVVKLAKNSGFHRKYILNLQKPIPIRVWGRLGPFRVSQILPQWNTQLGAFYLKDETGLERPVKLRSYNSVQYPGESERTFHLEISGRGPQLIDRVEAIVEPYVPGTAFRKSADAAGGAVVRSPMVGKIINVLVKDGDEVKKGQELLVIEAMKMENKIFSPASGTVSHLKATPGEQTGVGDQLLKIESE